MCERRTGGDVKVNECKFAVGIATIMVVPAGVAIRVLEDHKFRVKSLLRNTHTFTFEITSVPFGSAVKNNEDSAIAPRSAKRHVEPSAEIAFSRWYTLCIFAGVAFVYKRVFLRIWREKLLVAVHDCATTTSQWLIQTPSPHSAGLLNAVRSFELSSEALVVVQHVSQDLGSAPAFCGGAFISDPRLPASATVPYPHFDSQAKSSSEASTSAARAPSRVGFTELARGRC